MEVTVSIGVAHQKKKKLTGFAHRKFILWKSGGLNFQIFPGSILVTSNPGKLNR